MGKDTTTGTTYEESLRSYIERQCRIHGLNATMHASVGDKPGGGAHIVDWELISEADDRRRGLISCKFQTTRGTAEEKLPYEVMKLLYAMEANPIYKKAWLVLGGNGWTIKTFVLEELNKWIPAMSSNKIIIVPSTDEFFRVSLELL